MTTERSGPFLSVIVKCLNEAENLGACLRTLLAETASLDAEIIVVDSQSTDGSVDIARHHPVRIVQIAKAEDRRCG
ncbi:MAG: glycosyltransferase, partial [Acetobacteraceae bacterium]|nr:glycosyltransferase [Acetobacteraceae bacterium]